MTDQTLRLSCHSEILSRGSSTDEILQSPGFNLGPSTDTTDSRVEYLGQYSTPFLTDELGVQNRGTSENARLTPETQDASTGRASGDDVICATPHSLISPDVANNSHDVVRMSHTYLLFLKLFLHYLQYLFKFQPSHI